MKACEEYVTLMMLSIDGEASREEADSLHAHLEECTACRALYAQYMSIDEALKGAAEEPPEQLHTAIMNSIQEEKTQNQPRGWLKRYRFTALAAVAALVILAAAKFGGVSLFRDGASGAVKNQTMMDTGAALTEAAPEMAAEFHADGEFTGEAVENTEAAATAEQKTAPVPEPAPAAAVPEEACEAPEEIVSAEGKVNAESGAGVGFAECTEAIRNAGYSGTVLGVQNAGPDELKQAFPDMKELTLENGLIIYEIQQEDLQTVLIQFQVPVEYALESDAESRYFIYLLP